ncbi:MAG: glycosyltransferase family 2 protein [Saprospiraceae bacterium]|nr:glycosyltransferase family 2 protein [Saprospiraceae bacterium]
MSLVKFLDLSIVVPMLNEEESIKPLIERIKKVLTNEELSYEIIFIDDGSTDSTFSKVTEVASQNPQVKGISFSRNFGHQIAIYAGLQKARGKAVITMDGDLQHPPEVLPVLIAKWQQGFDIVNTIRIDPPQTGVFKKLTSKWFYSIINKLANINIQPAAADFRLMSRKAVEAFLEIEERDRFTRGLVSWMGFNQASVSYTADKRHSGTSKYSFSKMIRFALDGITSFSSRPLQISFYVGSTITSFGLLYALYVIVVFLQGKTIPGWTSILLVLLIIGGAILINLGIIGEYIARIFNEVKSRPHYFVKDSTYEGAEDEQTIR